MAPQLPESVLGALSTSAGQPPPPPPAREFASPDLEVLVRGSGKMLLLHKLLPKLRAEVGVRVAAAATVYLLPLLLCC
jgi:hypothetical protein